MFQISNEHFILRSFSVTYWNLGELQTLVMTMKIYFADWRKVFHCWIIELSECVFPAKSICSVPDLLFLIYRFPQPVSEPVWSVCLLEWSCEHAYKKKRACGIPSFPWSPGTPCPVTLYIFYTVFTVNKCVVCTWICSICLNTLR